jgi:sugar/nucleoside kinase (ribokinase family)
MSISQAAIYLALRQIFFWQNLPVSPIGRPKKMERVAGTDIIVLTRGEMEASIRHEGDWHNIYTAPGSELVDTVGAAGDTFMASMLV